MFNHIDAYNGDPIFALVEQFNKDIRANKVNLTIGFYFDEHGSVPNFNSVASARTWAFENPPASPTYLPMEGLSDYCKNAQKLAFGDNLDTHLSKIATLQSLGGSGALKVGADFIKRYFPKAQVWVSNPTWENHISIFKGAGFTVNQYRYYNKQTKNLDFKGMLEDLSALKAESVVLLHPCCHNPTGIDLSQEQWIKVIELIKKLQLIPFFDMAYQGFGEDLNNDTFAIKLMLQQNVPFFLAQSFSKIFSLYNERVGALSVACENAQTAKRVEGQLKFTVRTNYSTPPITGARLVNKILSEKKLKTQWQNELEKMKVRMADMRLLLVKKLSTLRPDYDFNFLLSQKGMFSYTGLSPQKIEFLKTQYGVYLLSSGRMCIAGLNKANIDAVAKAFASVY